MENFKKLALQISKSEVQFADQTELLSLFSNASEEELLPVVELFDKQPVWIGRINDNYKQKKKAFMEKDENLWHAILEEEKMILEEIEKENLNLTV